MRVTLRNKGDGLECIEKQLDAAIFQQRDNFCFSVLHEFRCLKYDRVGMVFEAYVSACHEGRAGLGCHACLHPRFLFYSPLPSHRRLYRNFAWFHRQNTTDGNAPNCPPPPKEQIHALDKLFVGLGACWWYRMEAEDVSQNPMLLSGIHFPVV